MGASIAAPSERLRPLISIESAELTGTLRPVLFASAGLRAAAE
jgi:hypothetical protein